MPGAEGSVVIYGNELVQLAQVFDLVLEIFFVVNHRSNMSVIKISQVSTEVKMESLVLSWLDWSGLKWTKWSRLI